MMTVSVALGSEELTENVMVDPGQTTALKLDEPLIPVAVGNRLGLQILVRNCISRTTLPMSTPFRYSRTRIAVTPISPFTVGNMLISPVTELMLTAGLDVSGWLAE